MFNSASVDEAKQSVDILTNLVQQMLQNNQELASRLSSLEALTRNERFSPAGIDKTSSDDSTSTIGPERHASGRDIHVGDPEGPSYSFDFDEDLSHSWVYTRAKKRAIRDSIVSAADFSFRWSCLSGTSLSEMSLANFTEVSVISLPISGREVEHP